MEKESIQGEAKYKSAMVYGAWWMLLLGCLARIAAYVRYRVLWLDESYTATSILEHSFTELFQPLGQFQIVPPFYLSLVKLFTVILGEHEYALRLPSLLSGLLFLVLVYQLLKRIATPLETMLALGIMVSSGMYIYYSAECKPYMLDTLIFTGLVFLALDFEQSAAPSWRKVLAFGVAGGIAVWTSFPSAFVLAGIGVVQGVRILAVQDWQRIRVLVVPYALWAGAFLLLYVTLIRPGLGADTVHHGQDLNTVMQQSWKFGFLPFPPTSLGELQLYENQALRIFYTPLGFRMRGLALFMAFVGMWSLWVRNRTVLGLLLCPIVITFLISLVKLYPFDGRMILFLTPALFIFVAFGIGYFMQRLDKGGWVIGAALIFLLILPAWGRMARNGFIAEERQEINFAFEHVQEQWQEGDLLYLTYYDSLVYRVAKYWYPLPEGANVFVEDHAWEYGSSIEEFKSYLLTQRLDFKRLWLPMGFHLDAAAFLEEIPDFYVLHEREAWGGIQLYQYHAELGALTTGDGSSD